MIDLIVLITNGFHEYRIVLNGGLFSKKRIEIYSTKKGQKFWIVNWIDGSEQRLTEKQLMDPNWTNIGLALQKGALIVDLNERTI